MVLEALAGSTEINDRQQHEDERLDEPDEDDVERLPDGEAHRAGHHTTRSAHDRECVVSKACDQGDHHAPGEDVAEEPERQRDRFDRLLEDVERDEYDACRQRQLKWLGEASQVTSPSQHADAVPLNHRDHDQAKRERLVQVGVGAVEDREEPKRQNLQPVTHEDVQEQGDRDRDDEDGVLGNVVFDQASEKVVAPFVDGLHLAGLARPQLRADPECDYQCHEHGEGAGDEAVVVECAPPRPAAKADRRVGDIDVGVDHARRPWRIPAATMTSCAAPTPMSTAHGAMPSTRAARIATALTAAIRTTLEATKGAPISSVPATRRPLKEPMMRPAPRPMPRDRFPAAPATITTMVAKAADATTVSRTIPPSFTA